MHLLLHLLLHLSVLPVAPLIGLPLVPEGLILLLRHRGLHLLQLLRGNLLLLLPLILTPLPLLVQLNCHELLLLFLEFSIGFQLRRHPLLRFVSLLGHVQHSLLHHFILLLLSLHGIGLVALDRVDQARHYLLHFLLVLKQRLEHL